MYEYNTNVLTLEVKEMLTYVFLIIDTTSQDIKKCSYFSYNNLPITYLNSVDPEQIAGENLKTPHNTLGYVGSFSFESLEKVIEDLCGFLRSYSIGRFSYEHLYLHARSINVPKKIEEKYFKKLKSSDLILDRKHNSKQVRPYDDIVKLYDKASSSTEPEIKIKDYMNILAYPGSGLDEAESYISRILSDHRCSIEISQSENEVLNKDTSLGQLDDYQDFGEYARQVRNAVSHYQRTDPYAPQIDLYDKSQEEQLKVVSDILGRIAEYKIMHSHEWYQEIEEVYRICNKEDIWWLDDEFLDDLHELCNGPEHMLDNKENALVKINKLT